MKLTMTPATQAVLRAMLADPTTPAPGAQISKAAGLTSGTITPILARMENAGIITHFGQPHRKRYRLTARGAEFARTTLALTEEGADS